MKLFKGIMTFIAVTGAGSIKATDNLDFKVDYLSGTPYFIREGTAQELQLYNREISQSHSEICVWIFAILSKLKERILLHKHEANSFDLEIIGYTINNDLTALRIILDRKAIYPTHEYQFRFVNFIFRVFYDSAFVIAVLSLKTSEQDMVDKMCQQSLKFLDLHDSFGNPDPLTPCYAVRVFRNKTFFKDWKKVLKANTDLPESLRVMLYHQISAAEYFLNVMGTKIKHGLRQKSEAFCM